MIPIAYTELLARYGRSLSDIGSEDVALPRLEALKAINALRGSNVAILGAAVIQIDKGRPEYTYDNVHCEPEEYGSAEKYIQGSWDETERYLVNYPDPLDGSIWYALTVKEITDLTNSVHLPSC